ncbi:MAG: cyclic nucleotide-binding domain-containing protein [Campylobacterales bacterium]
MLSLPEEGLYLAFIIGIISAASLPLGTLTSFVYRPSQKTIATLMAFGAGALLAALSIDLVGSALQHGHFNALAIGSLIGGLLFIGLDHLVGNYGGYRRKFSTTLQHRNLQNRSRLKETLKKLGRMDIFTNLDDEDVELLSQSVKTRFYAKGSMVFTEGDIADELYIVSKGSVELKGSSKGGIVLHKGDSFGRVALFAGVPYALNAETIESTWLTIIPKEALESLLLNSKEYRKVVLEWMKSYEFVEHLKKYQEIDDKHIQEWLSEVEESFEEECILPDMKPVERNEDEFMKFATKLQRVPWLDELEEEEAEALADFLIYKEIKRGDYLFKEGQPAHKLFLIKSGEVELNEASDKNRLHKQDKGDGVGARAFLCGLRHTVSVKATKKTRVWILRRSDFDKLLRLHPNFKLRVLYYLEDSSLKSYLSQRHGLSQDRITSWIQRAVKSIKNSSSPVTMLEIGIETKGMRGASIAIWLGILLDGVPESLVIGANMINHGISLSLIAGLFLSNYPEALSSSIGMREEGMSKGRILFMWTSIMIFTGVGASIGHVFMENAEPYYFGLLEGLAVGAMLTMIAQTMLPEAYHRGSGVVGMATLLGFLATVNAVSR